MKVYEVKRNGITILLANDELPKDGDEVLREFDVEPQENIAEVEDGDYLLHLENGEWTLRKKEVE